MRRLRLSQWGRGKRFQLYPGGDFFEAGALAIDRGTADRMVSMRKITQAGLPADEGWPRQIPVDANVWVEGEGG